MMKPVDPSIHPYPVKKKVGGSSIELCIIISQRTEYKEKQEQQHERLAALVAHSPFLRSVNKQDAEKWWKGLLVHFVSLRLVVQISSFS
jgi:hypothetical protein